MYFEGCPRLCPSAHGKCLSTSATQVEQSGLESWPRSPSPVGPSPLSCMPVTSHVAISYSVIRCPFNSWKNRGVVRCSLYTCSFAMLHLAATVSLPSISNTFISSASRAGVFPHAGTLRPWGLRLCQLLHPHSFIWLTPMHPLRAQLKSCQL